MGQVNYNGDVLTNVGQVVLSSYVTSDMWTAAFTTLTSNSGLWVASYSTLTALSASWSSQASANAPVSAGGGITDVQFNNGGGQFAGVPAFTFNQVSSALSVPYIIFSALTGTNLSYYNTATACNAYITFNVGTSSYGIPLVRV